MSLIELQNISKRYEDREIFRQVSLQVDYGTCLGLIGMNGCGKTTLVNIIMEAYENGQTHGSDPSYKGRVKIADGIRIAYLAQVSDQVLEEEASTFILGKSGFLDMKQMNDLRIRNLSGGERTKQALANLIETYPEVLILDEPTNHLDVRGMAWLKEALVDYYGAIIIISHDRYFLDQTVHQIAELKGGRLETYDGNYSDYLTIKTHRHKSQVAAYDKLMKEQKAIQSEITQLKAWSDKAHRDSTKKQHITGSKFGMKEYFRVKAKKRDQQIKSKVKQLEKKVKEGPQRPEEALNLYFRFGNEGHRGSMVLGMENLKKSFGHRCLFESDHIYLYRGDKMALLGPNGSGKTTLIRMLLGQDRDYEGVIRLNTGLKIAYISQDILDLPIHQGIMDYLDCTNHQGRTKAYQTLDLLGLPKSIWDKPIGTMSMGERTRVKLAKVILDEVDLLILDEPTNHLDIETREVLEEALTQYDGTLILCAHDPYLVERTCDQMLCILDKRLVVLKENPSRYYEEALWQVKVTNLLSPQKTKEKEDQLLLEVRKAKLLGEMAGMDPLSGPYRELKAIYEDLDKKQHS